MEGRNKTWKPIVAGVLNIIVGSLRLMVVLGIIIAIIVINNTPFWNQIDDEVYPLTIGFVVGILVVIAVFFAIMGILSLLGGIFGIQRKMWGLALAGSIASVFGPFILGIPALVFIIISKEEFDGIR